MSNGWIDCELQVAQEHSYELGNVGIHDTHLRALTLDSDSGDALRAEFM
jgi:hypothetical protein